MILLAYISISLAVGSTLNYTQVLAWFVLHICSNIVYF